MCENGSEYGEMVDPRVHIELERLNNATDEINKLEVELDEARNNFRQLLCDSTARVEAIRAKLGICVERARPYYEARFTTNEALKQTQIAAMKFERANSAHSAAREMVYLAEQGLGGRTLDPAWQEMLNHATQRVNDAETDRSIAESEHRFACLKHEAANTKVQSLQKDLKRAINKSRPYYEMKAHFYQLLDAQKYRIQKLESHVGQSKLTYSQALRNLEQISDEIHQTRRKASLKLTAHTVKQGSIDSNESLLDDAQDLIDEYKGLPGRLTGKSDPITCNLEEIDGYKNANLDSPESPQSDCEKVDPSLAPSQSSEWTEINLDSSSPEEEKSGDGNAEKSKLFRQKTMPTSSEFSALKNKMKLDTSITNWITRSAVKNEEVSFNSSRRQSLDNLLGPTSEKMKEIFSHGMMMLNIGSMTERRNSEPKVGITESKGVKKLPSPLEKTLTYLTVEDDNSDTESVSSVDMLNDDQIASLMLDKDIGAVCEELLGTPISEVISFPHVAIKPNKF
ncbi:unnamed protein product [Brassicogethes aeneus]|uniref:SH3 domain-binding protein 5-like n=1 Tax=Brassicogethes aeneus TaxID=1431903 RepID=A0A9P0AZH8_BRAAE|nr:unnamed protein product [Brassicogethes aeneus]